MGGTVGGMGPAEFVSSQDVFSVGPTEKAVDSDTEQSLEPGHLDSANDTSSAIENLVAPDALAPDVVEIENKNGTDRVTQSDLNIEDAQRDVMRSESSEEVQGSVDLLRPSDPSDPAGQLGVKEVDMSPGNVGGSLGTRQLGEKPLSVNTDA